MLESPWVQLSHPVVKINFRIFFELRIFFQSQSHFFWNWTFFRYPWISHTLRHFSKFWCYYALNYNKFLDESRKLDVSISSHKGAQAFPICEICGARRWFSDFFQNAPSSPFLGSNSKYTISATQKKAFWGHFGGLGACDVTVRWSSYVVFWLSSKYT